MAKGKAKGGAKAQSAASDTARACTTCSEEKPKAEFTGGQWKKAEGRQCKSCTEAEEALLKPAEESKKLKEEEQRKMKEADLAERQEKNKEMPADGEKAKQKRREIAMTKVLQDEGELQDKVTFASYLEIDVEDIKEDAAAIQGRLFVAVRSTLMNRSASERGAYNAYTKTLTDDELLGLACELDLLMSELEGKEREIIISQVREAAKQKANKRMCETCSEWKPRNDFGQNQWKRTNGSRCKECMKREEEERKYLEDHKRMYGQLPEEMEDDVYTSQANLYETLQLTDDASQEDIKKSYRKLAIKHHPDRFASKPEEERLQAEEVFKLITEAYETLSNSAKKSQYDKELQRKARKAKKKAAAAAAKEDS